MNDGSQPKPPSSNPSSQPKPRLKQLGGAQLLELLLLDDGAGWEDGQGEQKLPAWDTFAKARPIASRPTRNQARLEVRLMAAFP